MDVQCAKCGEPWDYYGLNNGDMTPGEARKFKAGLGCPACGFGTKCPYCGGTGVERVEGCKCLHGKVLGRQCVTSSWGTRWTTGYSPYVKELPVGAIMIEEKEGFECRDGWVREAWFVCPECGGKQSSRAIMCASCDGTGKLIVQEDQDLRAAEQEIDATDEDGLEVLGRRGLI